jgi:hypothetical protein
MTARCVSVHPRMSPESKVTTVLRRCRSDVRRHFLGVLRIDLYWYGPRVLIVGQFNSKISGGRGRVPSSSRNLPAVGSLRSSTDTLLKLRAWGQYRRGLAHFAQSAEQNVPVPFSEAVLSPGSKLIHYLLIAKGEGIPGLCYNPAGTFSSGAENEKMRSHSTSRTLRFETLETRSMLAGTVKVIGGTIVGDGANNALVIHQVASPPNSGAMISLQIEGIGTELLLAKPQNVTGPPTDFFPPTKSLG